MLKHIESGISGRMMGYNSLFYIQNTAKQLGIKGAVFIKPDGSIKVVAEGEERALLEFTEKIKEGKIFSETENFYVKWSAPVRDSENFYVVAN